MEIKRVGVHYEHIVAIDSDNNMYKLDKVELTNLLNNQKLEKYSKIKWDYIKIK